MWVKGCLVAKKIDAGTAEKGNTASRLRGFSDIDTEKIELRHRNQKLKPPRTHTYKVECLESCFYEDDILYEVSKSVTYAQHGKVDARRDLVKTRSEY